MYVRPSGIRLAGDAAYLPDFGCCFHGGNPDDSGQERTLDADGNGDLLRYADQDDFPADRTSGCLSAAFQRLHRKAQACECFGETMIVYLYVQLTTTIMKLKSKYTFLLVLAGMCQMPLQAQQTYSLEDCIREALINNVRMKNAANDLKAAQETRSERLYPLFPFGKCRRKRIYC